MVVRRIKDRWHNSTPDNDERVVLDEKSLLDQASALAYIFWKLALNGAINLHAEDFRYDNDQQRVGVISELLAFQIQFADRLSHGFISDAERETLIAELCAKISDQVQDNLTDIAGAGSYRAPFIALLNRRFGEYAKFEYKDGLPSYDQKRYLGMLVLEIMGDDQTNRWVVDQIIEIDVPDLIAQDRKSFNRLFGLDKTRDDYIAAIKAQTRPQ